MEQTFKFRQQSSFLLWWVSFLQASLLGSCIFFFPTRGFFCSFTPTASFPVFPITGFLPGTLLIWVGFQCCCCLIHLEFVILAPGKNGYSGSWSWHMGLASVRFSGFCVDSTLGLYHVWCSEGSLDLWAFPQIISPAGSTFGPKAETSHELSRGQVSKCSVCFH